MEFKDVCQLDKSDALFSVQYSDPPDTLSQDLVGKFKRIQKQIELMRDEPEKADRIVFVVKEEMKNNLVFAKHAFNILDGRETVENLVKKNMIQTYLGPPEEWIKPPNV